MYGINRFVQPGGKGANQCAAIAKSGLVDVSFLACRGQDSDGHTIDELFKELKVNRLSKVVEDVPTGVKHPPFLSLGERCVWCAAKAAVNTHGLHQHLERAPVVCKRVNDEIDEPVRLRLPLRRRTEVVLRTQFAYLREMTRDDVVIEADAARKRVAHCKRGDEQLVASGEPDSFLAKHALQALACVEVAPRVLDPLHVLEIEKPYVTVRHQRGIKGIDHERQISRLADGLIVAHCGRKILSEIDGRDGRNPIYPRIRRCFCQRDRIVGADAPHLRDQLATPLRRLYRPAIDAHTLLVREEHSLAGRAGEIEPLQSALQSVFY